MFHAPMVDLARSAAEVKKEMTTITSMPDRAPEYPCGCCISLDDETLEKVGLSGDLPSLGSLIHFCAVAKVTSASMSESMDGDGKPRKCCRVELQIVQMGIPTANKDRGQAWYGNGSDHAEPDGDED